MPTNLRRTAHAAHLMTSDYYVAREPRNWHFERSWAALALFLAGHCVFGVVIHNNPTLATLHALAAAVVSCGIALLSSRLEWVAYSIAYLAGSEVLWRASQANVLWETGKLSVAVVAFCALIRMRETRLPIPAMLYFLLLLPSMLETYRLWKIENAMTRWTAFLSGPLALAVCACFFSNCRLTKQQIHQTFLAFILPITSLWFVASYGTFSKQVQFGSESMAETSGGYGPNQVSAVLGLGGLLLGLYLMQSSLTIRRKLLIGGLMIAFLAQSALTLSRGGLYAAFGAMLPSMAFLARDRRSQLRVLLTVASVALIGVFIVYPFLDSYTSGALSRRFADRGMTHREQYMISDLETWLENPIFGVGVGFSQFQHSNAALNHNEITRTLAEHGLFGLGALIMMAIMIFRRILSARTMEERAQVSALLTWGVLFVFANGARIAAPSFIIGLAMTRPRN